MKKKDIIKVIEKISGNLGYQSFRMMNGLIMKSFMKLPALVYMFCLVPFISEGQITQTIYSSKVTTIWQGSSGNDNFGNSQVMQQESYSQKTRCLIQFDLGAIPSNATISSATLRVIKTNTLLCDNSGNGGSSITIGIRRLTVNWSEGTAWSPQRPQISTTLL